MATIYECDFCREITKKDLIFDICTKYNTSSGIITEKSSDVCVRCLRIFNKNCKIDIDEEWTTLKTLLKD